MFTTKIITKPWVVQAPLDEVVEELSSKHGWTTCEFVNDGRWTFEPLSDSTLIPPEGRHRMKLLEETGVQVSYIVAHEKPYEPLPRFTQDETNKILLITGAVVLFLAFAWLIVLALPLLMMGAIMLVGCTSGDPVLVAHGVNEKGEEVWTSLFRWYS